MDQVVLAFITGITTGGLSCLAVQGGLLASSLANQIETDLSRVSPKVKKSLKRASPAHRVNATLPIILFLTAKLAAYTLLGVLLGLVGSFLTFDPITRAILLIGIAIFMIGNGLRMLDVHPIFRYFSIEPPKFITRAIRRTAKNGTEYFTPIFLGLFTVFIPCGVTQAMMAAALGTGNAATGAALMFAFTLGTSPVFFLVAYLATQIGARLEKFFMRFVAIVVLVLGLLTLENGLNLMGAPFSFANLTSRIMPVENNSESIDLSPAAASNELILTVANDGYFPGTLRAKANQAVSLRLETNKTYSCARDFVIPALKYYTLLPETGVVKVDISPQAPGTTIFFTCSMGMYTGRILFEQ